MSENRKVDYRPRVPRRTDRNEWDEDRFPVAAYFDGAIVRRSRDGGEYGDEPNCAVCGEPIRWCLDMFSFTMGYQEPAFALAHARCVWVRDAFETQAKLAPTSEELDR